MIDGALLASESPARTVDQLEALVRGDLRGRLQNFAILPRPEGLILRGTTRTFHVKQLAQNLIMTAAGHVILANQIEVG